MYIPLGKFYDGKSASGYGADSEFSTSGIAITYSLPTGEKQVINFNYQAIAGVYIKPGKKLLIVFYNNTYQYLEIKSIEPVVSILKMAGHPPTYHSVNDFISSDNGKVITIIGGAIAIILALYFYIIPFAADTFAQNLPIEYEVNLGNKIYNQLISQDSIDTLQTNLVNQFAKEINFDTKYNLEITVVHNKELNAFATPGGHILVYDGLLNKLENQEELTGLLAHEATHVRERHSLRAMASDLSRSIFLSIILHDRSGISSVLIQNADMLNSLRYSRDMERLADKGAVETMVRNNINPNGMIQLLSLLKRQDKTDQSYTYLSTHPATQERISDVRDFIQENQFNVKDNSKRSKIWDELEVDIARKEKSAHH
ncbi:MAG: M48 family metallopeptidase [Bacteroidetes bacterium]|nr:M48 family metallopeptidase [Bacteroidota bacterium]